MTMETRLRVEALRASDIVPGLECVAVRQGGNALQVVLFEVLTLPEQHRDPEGQTFEAKCLMIDGVSYNDEDSVTELTLTDIGCPRKGSLKGILCRTFPLMREKYDMLVYNIVLQSAQNVPREVEKLFGKQDAHFTWIRTEFPVEKPRDGSLPNSISGFVPRQGTLGTSVLAGQWRP